MKIIKKDIVKEMRENLTVYAEEVNEHRALPSIEDGLRPSLRFLLYCLWKEGFRSDKQYIKCASPIGLCLSRYYVHGDQALYGVLTNISMPWKNPQPLIDFHGGLGTPDDPNANASMRYTECRMSPAAELMMDDLKTALPSHLWEDNYLQTEKVPKYFPTAFPNLLVNPTLGIGWATACNFLPHSLTSVYELINRRIKNPSANLSEIIGSFAPYFPSGGVILNGKDLLKIYSTGRGNVVVSSVWHWEKDSLIITELPYKVGPKTIIKQIIKQQKEKNDFEWIDNIYDNTTLEQTQLIIECEKGIDKDNAIQQLLKKTSLRENYKVNMTALRNGKPATLSLLEIVDYFIKQQHDRITNRANYYLSDYNSKLFIQEGLLKVLGDIDKAIEIIRGAEDEDEAIYDLCQWFEIVVEQAKAITAIRLGKLTKIGIKEVQDTIDELKNKIAEQEEIINSPEKRISIWQGEIAPLLKTKEKITTKVEDGTANQDGDTLTEVGYLNCHDLSKCEIDEEYLDDGWKPINPECDEYYILTNKARGFVRRGNEFKSGISEWKELIKVEDDEYPIWFGNFVPTGDWVFGQERFGSSLIKKSFTRRGKQIVKVESITWEDIVIG